MTDYYDEIKAIMHEHAETILTDKLKRLNLIYTPSDYEALRDAVSELALVMHDIITEKIAMQFEIKRIIKRSTLINFLKMRSWISDGDHIEDVITDTFFNEGQAKYIETDASTMSDLAVQIYQDCCFAAGYQNEEPEKAIHNILDLLIDEVEETLIERKKEGN